MDLLFDAPAHHHLVVEGVKEPVAGGEQFTVGDLVGRDLLLDPHVSVKEAAPKNLAGLNREQLDELAVAAGFDPKNFKTKQDVIDALQTNQPEADGAGHNPIQED